MDEPLEEVMDNRRRRKARRAEAVTEYRMRTRKVRGLNRDEDRSQVQKILKEDLERANELYPVVKKKLDGTMADARHVRELVHLGYEASKRINANSKPFEMRKVIKNLMRYASEETGQESINVDDFSKFIVENHVSTFLLRPPSFEFFYGSIRTEGLQVAAKKERKVREKMVASTSVTAKEKDIDGPDVEQDSTPKEVEQIYTKIRGLVENKRRPAPFFKTLVDPNSFTQTVENIFHVSFLVKEGKIGVEGDNPNKAVLTVNENAEGRKEEGIQSVLSFSMDDYEAWLGR